MHRSGAVRLIDYGELVGAGVKGDTFENDARNLAAGDPWGLRGLRRWIGSGGRSGGCDSGWGIRRCVSNGFFDRGAGGERCKEGDDEWGKEIQGQDVPETDWDCKSQPRWKCILPEAFCKVTLQRRSVFLFFEIPDNRSGEAWDIVGMSLECRWLAVFAQCLAGDRADAACDTTLGPFQTEREKVIDRGT